MHTFACVLALQIAHLMRRQAERAGLRLSVHHLLGQLAAIGETVLIYPSAGSRPKARRKTPELAGDQPEALQHLRPGPVRPTELGHTPAQAATGPLTSKNDSQPRDRWKLGRRSSLAGIGLAPSGKVPAFTS